MKIVDAFWLNNIGFVKVDNGFESKVYVGQIQGYGEQQDAEWIARHGSPVPRIQLSQFLEEDKYKGQYVTE